MQNVVTLNKKNGESYHFKYEVGQDERTVIESITDLVSQGKLNCFDAAMIRYDLEKAEATLYGSASQTPEAAD